MKMQKLEYNHPDFFCHVQFIVRVVHDVFHTIVCTVFLCYSCMRGVNIFVLFEPVAGLETTNTLLVIGVHMYHCARKIVGHRCTAHKYIIELVLDVMSPENLAQ